MHSHVAPFQTTRFEPVGGGGWRGRDAGAGCCHSGTAPQRFAPGTRGCSHALTRICTAADLRRRRLELLAAALRPFLVAHRPRRRVVWSVATPVAPDAGKAGRGRCCLTPGGGSHLPRRRRTPAVTRWRAETAGGWRGWRYVSRCSPLFFSRRLCVCGCLVSVGAPLFPVYVLCRLGSATPLCAGGGGRGWPVRRDQPP